MFGSQEPPERFLYLIKMLIIFPHTTEYIFNHFYQQLPDLEILQASVETVIFVLTTFRQVFFQFHTLCINKLNFC